MLCCNIYVDSRSQRYCVFITRYGEQATFKIRSQLFQLSDGQTNRQTDRSKNITSFGGGNYLKKIIQFARMKRAVAYRPKMNFSTPRLFSLRDGNKFARRVGIPQRRLPAALAWWKNGTPVCTAGYAGLWISGRILSGWTRSVISRPIYNDTTRYSTDWAV